ncbi:MAG: RluA family pseudouridine synthase [Planctomycetaceae bacterium]|jgi:23S rRNA pseudouridine1911/1915/1917 synthase|nr:RluA family pseudouridine synthase [Planctomycetaceae bacterium]
MQILYEDNHLIALVKPCGIAVMGLPAGQETLLTQTKAYIKVKYNKPGEVYLGVVSRLDVPVSGVVLFARTSKAAARINEQFRTHTVEKIYAALVEGFVQPPEDECIDRLENDKRHRKVHITDNLSGKESLLRYKTLRRIGKNTLLEINLQTGRKHQIRLQLSSRGYPILGDIKYGSRLSFRDGIALHAWKLRFDHPITKERIELVAELPSFGILQR